MQAREIVADSGEPRLHLLHRARPDDREREQRANGCPHGLWLIDVDRVTGDHEAVGAERLRGADHRPEVPRSCGPIEREDQRVVAERNAIEVVGRDLRDCNQLRRIFLLAQLRQQSRLHLVVDAGDLALEEPSRPVGQPPAARIPERLDGPTLLDGNADPANTLHDEPSLARALPAVRQQARRQLELVVRDGQPPSPRLGHAAQRKLRPVLTRDDGLAERLAATTLALVDTPSESRKEQEIAELVAATVPLDAAYRSEATLLFATARTGRPLVILAGHLDTVPENRNLPGKIENGVVYGLGASDMKGGLAVMIELARWVTDARPELAVDLAFLFFPREELPAGESALPDVLATGLLDDAELVVMLEPTDNTIQSGCLGNLNAELVFEGLSAHSARPWLGENAITLAVEALEPIVRLPPRDVEIEGLLFREVLSVTGIEGGLATNVIPDRATCTLNFRYAPDRSEEDAQARLQELLGRPFEVRGNSPPARVVTDTPLLRRLRDAGNFALEPKQAWTPVAEFSGHGLDAINLGPGATRYAHTRDEQVSAPELERTFRALQRFMRA